MSSDEAEAARVILDKADDGGAAGAEKDVLSPPEGRTEVPATSSTITLAADVLLSEKKEAEERAAGLISKVEGKIESVADKHKSTSAPISAMSQAVLEHVPKHKSSQGGLVLDLNLGYEGAVQRKSDARFFAKFRDRFMSLRGSILYMYDAEGAPAHESCIQVDGRIKVVGPKTHTSGFFAFTISGPAPATGDTGTTGNFSWKLRTAGSASGEKWLKALSTVGAEVTPPEYAATDEERAEYEGRLAEYSNMVQDGTVHGHVVPPLRSDGPAVSTAHDDVDVADRPPVSGGSTGKLMYKVHVFTGNFGQYKIHTSFADLGRHEPASPKDDENIFISLHGARGPGLKKAKFPKTKKSFHEGHEDTFELEGDVVGELYGLTLEKDKPGHTWYVDRIVVTAEDAENSVHKWVFPVYSWVDMTKYVLEGSARLPQQLTVEAEQKERSAALEHKRKAYRVHKETEAGIPPRVDSGYADLPINEQWPKDKGVDFQHDRNTLVGNTLLSKVSTMMNKWDTFDDFDKLFVKIPLPSVKGNWHTDEQFGKNRTQMSSVANLRAVPVDGKLPELFGVTEADVEGQLPPGATLASEAAARHLFYLEFPYLQDLPTQEGRYSCSPFCLLRVRSETDSALIPLAIQLHRRPRDDSTNPIFTAADPGPDWLLAKSVVNHADMWQFQMNSHLLYTHLGMEAVVVVTHRRLSEAHPVFKLLKPFTKYHLGINSVGRLGLLGAGGLIEQVASFTVNGFIAIIARGYDEWTFADAAPPKMLADRGFDDPEVRAAIPDYHYANDALDLWTIVHDYVQDIMKLYYTSDQDVVDDTEVQAWAAELHESYEHTKDGRARFPASFATIAELVETVAIFCFAVSVQHGVLNFAQYDTFGYIPNSPGTLMAPVPGHDGTPVEKGKMSKLEDIMAWMPNKSISAFQVGNHYLLAQYTDADQFLGTFGEQLFVEAAALGAQKRFKDACDAFEAKVKARGGWDHSLPSKIPMSTAI